jgi:hypothetical protein
MNKAIKKPFLLLMLIAIFSMALSGSVYAHGNGNKDHGKKGNDDYQKASINAATAVTLIVKGLDLNIDNIRFIKEPKASDYYTKVKDDASYAKYFIIAQFNGLGLPKDINPSAKVTREQFAKWLYGALSNKGEYAWIDIYLDIADADQVTKENMDSIQKLLISKIATLDSKQKFYPKQNITKEQAEVFIAKTVKFIASMNKPVPNPESTILSDIKLTADSLSADVTRVTVSALAPHPGYGIDIASVQYVKGEAIIHYRVVQPDPAAMYAQVITEVKAVTYIPSKYKPVLGPLESSEPRT